MRVRTSHLRNLRRVINAALLVAEAARTEPNPMSQCINHRGKELDWASMLVAPEDTLQVLLAVAPEEIIEALARMAHKPVRKRAREDGSGRVGRLGMRETTEDYVSRILDDPDILKELSA
jgi:hypothetical protein